MNHIIKQHAPFLLIIVLLAVGLVYFAVFRAPAQEAIFLVGEGEALPEFCVPPGVTPVGDQQVCARQSPSILYGASILASGDITDEDVAEGSFPIVALDGADKIINPTTSLLFDETNARLAISKESDNAMGLYVSNDDATDSPNARALVVVGKDVGLGSTTVGRLSYSGPGYLRDGAPTTGTDFYQNKVVLQAGEDTSGMVFHHASLTALGRFWWEMNGESKMILSDAGLGLFLDANGTTLPTEKLEVNGNIKVTAGNDVCIDGGNCLSTAGGGGASYEVYTALLTQSGTSAPVDTVLENTLSGGTPVWSYDSLGGPGAYDLTMPGGDASTFPVGQTFILVGPGDFYPPKLLECTPQAGNPVIHCVTETATDNVLSNSQIEIRVYP